MAAATDTKEWLPKKLSWGAIPTSRSFHFSFARSQNIYVFGGDTETPGPNELFALYCLNTKSMTWTEIVCTGNQPPLNSRHRSTCCDLGNKMYCLDSRVNAAGKVTSIELFELDLVTYTWSSKPTSGNLPLTLNEATTAAIGNRIWTFGGCELAGTYSNTLRSLDLMTLVWTQETSYEGPIPRANHSMVAVGNNLLLGGGRTYSTAVPYPLMTLYCFDTVSKKWRDTHPRGTPVPSAREGIALASYEDGKLVWFGGYNSRSLGLTNEFNDMYVLNTEGPKITTTTFNPQWMDFVQLNRAACAPQPRMGSSMVIIVRLKPGLSQEDTSFIDAFLAAKEEEVPKPEGKPKDEVAGETKKDERDDVADKMPESFRGRLKWAVDNEKTFPDVAFSLKGKLIYAHKVILTARSVVFRKKWDPTYGGAGDDVSQSHLDVSAESAATPPRSHRPNSPAMASLRGAMNGKKTAATPPQSGSGSGKKKKPSKSSDDSDDDAAVEDTKKPVSGTSGSGSDEAKGSEFASGGKIDAPGIEVITIAEDFEEADFREVLNYMYMGEIELKNEDHADRISSIGFEYLLDDLMKLCRTKTFPAKLRDPDDLYARAFRRLVGNPTGTDIFFVVKRKKLLAHRGMLYLFSAGFHKMLTEDPNRRYIEVKDVGNQELDVKTFIDFCRMMYCGFSAMPEHKEKQTDVAGLLALALHFKEDKLIDLLAANSVVNNDNVAQIYSVCTKFNLKSLRRTCLMHLVDHFGEVVQDKPLLSKWSPKLIAEILELYRKTTSFNWLDMLWFAANTGNDSLQDEAVKELDDLLNIENVIPLLVGSHHCGAKALRSKCVDYVLSHASNVEQVRRMQHFSAKSITEVSGLSTSLNAEMAQKVSSQVSINAQGLQKSKVCTICATEFSFFGAKKNQCTLCKRLACNNCMVKKFQMPPVFGFNKPKPVCKSCLQMVGLLGIPSSAPAAAGATTATATQPAAATTSN